MLVVDASVIVRWLISDPERESDTARATALMRRVVDGEEAVAQPIHWLLEVGAVLARISPATAEDDLAMLEAMELRVADEPPVLARACRLAIDLDEHLFDTLYHAVALETPGATLITADERYLRAAAAVGGVVHLSEWR
jgi:predicted nucleic acid-binding protein